MTSKDIIIQAQIFVATLSDLHAIKTIDYWLWKLLRERGMETEIKQQ